MDGRRGSPSRPVSAALGKMARSETSVGIRSETRVGIVFHSYGGGYEIKLYLVDIDVAAGAVEEEYSVIKPAVRFLFQSVHEDALAVCVLESTVYMFGGYDPRPIEPPHPKDKYARAFELSEKVFPNGDLLVKEEELVEIPPMKYHKGLPRAIPTPDGKGILVFSTVIRVKNAHRAFEMYDPREKSWDVLPNFPCSCGHYPTCSDDDEDYESDGDTTEPETDSEAEWLELGHLYCACLWKIESYAFVDESHFFVKSKNVGFILDILNKKWSFVPDFVRGVDYFVVVKAEHGCDYVISAGMLQAIKNGFSREGFMTNLEGLPLSSFNPPIPWNNIWDNSIVPLISGEGFCTMGILQAELQKEEIHLLIDVCRISLDIFSTENIKRLKLCIKVSSSVGELRMISI